MLIPALRPNTQLLIISSLFLCFSFWNSTTIPWGKPLNNPSSSNNILEQGVVWLNETEVRSEIGYPELARRSGITGDVYLEVLVNESGAISNLNVAHSDHPLLEIACIDKLILSRFSSATKDGNPIPAWTSMKFSFR